jgi:hypothetical protein
MNDEPSVIDPGRGRPTVAAMVRRSRWSLVRRCEFAAAFVLVVFLLAQGNLAVSSWGQYWSTDWSTASTTHRLVVDVGFALATIVFLFSAGLLRVLVGAEAREALSGGGALATGRRAIRLLVVWLVSAAFLALVAYDAIGLRLAAPIAIVLGTVPFAFGFYVVPLIVDRRLSIIGAIRESTRFVRAAGFFRHWLLVVCLLAGAAGFGWLTVRAISVAGASWRPSATDTSTWLVSSQNQDSSMESWHASITYETIMVGVVGAAFGVLFCFLAALALAAAYSRRVTDDTPALAEPAAGVARRHIGRRLVVPVLVLALLSGATAFVWSYVVPFRGHTLAPGQQVTMRNGLTVTAPATGRTTFGTYRWYPAWLGGPRETAVDQLRSDAIDGDVRSLSAGHDPATVLGSFTSPPVVAASADGSVQFRWKSGYRFALVVIHLPGRLPGVATVWIGGFMSPGSKGPAQMVLAVEQFWRTFSIQGATIPAITGWRSRAVAPGRRVTLASGLSVVMPHGWPAAVARSSLTGFPAESFMPALLDTTGLWYARVYSRSRSDPWLKGVSQEQRIARSSDGTVEVWGMYGQGGGGTSVTVVTHLPGRSIGVIDGYFKDDALTRAAAWSLALRMWKIYGVEGVAFPRM